MSAIRQIEDRMVLRNFFTAGDGTIIDTSARKLQAYDDATATTTEPTFIVSYADTNGSTLTLATNVGSLNGTTPVDLIGVPASGSQRAISSISIYNADTVTHTIKVRLLDTATPYIIGSFVVPAGYTLFYTPDTGWQVGSTTGPGTVTSVAMTGDGTVFNAAVTGSPITGAGTLAPTLHTQVQKTFLGGPTSGADATPTFRTLAAADIPDISATYLPLAGGTMSGAILLPNGSAAAPELAFNTNYGLYYTTSDPASAAAGLAISNAGSYVANFHSNGLTISPPNGTGAVLRVVSDNATSTFTFRSFNNTFNSPPLVNMQRGRGSIASPLVPVTNDALAFVQAAAYVSGTGVAPTNAVSGRIAIFCTETATVSATASGADIRFFANAIGGVTLPEIMRLNSEPTTTGGLSMGGANLVINNSRQFVSSIATAAIQPTLSDATTNVTSDVAMWNHITSGTAAANFGSQQSWTWENASGNQILGGRFGFRWVTATNAAEDSEAFITTIQGGALQEKIIRFTPRGYVVSAANSRVTADFTKTTDTTLANVTGLTANVAAGKTYAFKATLYYAADAVGGHKYAIAGTATATDIRYHIASIADATNLFVITATQTALAGASGQAGSTGGKTLIEGTITVNAAGTLTVQFAENASSGSSSVKRGSTFQVTEID